MKKRIFLYHTKNESNKLQIKKKCIMFCIFLSLCLITSNVLAFGPSSTPLFNGIDVSQWQEAIDYSEVSEDGIEIVYIRAGEGFSYVDPYYMSNYNNAKDNGIKVGFYHYVTATSEEEAIQQADFFASLVEGLEIDCRLAMDFEEFNRVRSRRNK